MSESLRIIYMGTPEFAVASLDALAKAGCNIVAVITAPDKPSGRGQQINQSPVKIKAVELGIPVLQPTSLKDPGFMEELASYKADLQIVVAFRMLPEMVWNMPRLGTFNLHASLLPAYRGAAPINWAIINGEKESGITTFFLKHEIDTGNVIFQEREPIYPDDNVGSLYERLMNKGGALVVKTVKAIESGNYPQLPQEGEIKHAPKIFKEDCKIDWHKGAEKVHNFVRGLSPYPAAFMLFNDKTFKVFKTSFELGVSNKTIGEFDTDHKTYLKFRTVDGWVSILELQPEGKKRLVIEEFLRGYKF